MKITTKILCQRVKGPLSQALHLDMSGLGIGAVEGLEYCTKIESLDLSKNCLEELENFECCKNLWRINLSNNQLSCLTTLSQMYAIGVLDLSNNLLSWSDLIRLRHVHILDLRLHGNEKLENDTYYRLHVVDCLPNVWMLDGRLITFAERLQVQQFFHDSALSNRPVRHKLNDKSFLCSKSTKTGHIHGNRTCRFSSCFPMNEPHSSETDKRRLEFLAENIEEDLKVMNHSVRWESDCISNQCLQIVIKSRHKDKEKSNMLLLLLIASLEFGLPETLIKQTLEVAKLNPMFDTDTLQLFNLEPSARIDVISLLVSSCKLDRDIQKPTTSNFTSGGLYDRLYLCLYHSVAHLIKTITKKTRKRNGSLADWKEHNKMQRNHLQRPQTAPARHRQSYSGIGINSNKRLSVEWKAHESLLASELVLLLSVVPSFYHLISESNPSICNVLRVATGDYQLSSRLARLSHDLALHGGDINAFYREICRSVIQRMELAALNTSNMQESLTLKTANQNIVMSMKNAGKISENTKQARFILNASGAYPRRPKSAVLTSGEHLTTGKSRRMPPSAISSTKSYDSLHLTLGSMVLLGAQNLAKVIALPEQDVALVQMDSVPAPNGSVTIQTRDVEEHYCYVDVGKLEYDYQTGYWKPRGAVGDIITLQAPHSDSADFKIPAIKSNTSSKAIEYRMSSKTDQNMVVTRVPSQNQTRNISYHSKKRLSSPPRTSGCSQSGSFMIMMDDPIRDDTGIDGHEEEELPPPQRPLSSLFCEKMELTLSESAFQIGMFPEVFSEWPRSNGIENLSKNKRDLGQSTFLTQAMPNLMPKEHTPGSGKNTPEFVSNNEFTDREFAYRASRAGYYAPADEDVKNSHAAWGYDGQQKKNELNVTDTMMISYLDNDGNTEGANIQLDDHMSQPQVEPHQVKAQAGMENQSIEYEQNRITPRERSIEAESQNGSNMSPCPPVNIPMPSIDVDVRDNADAGDEAARKSDNFEDEDGNDSLASDEEPELQAITNESAENNGMQPAEGIVSQVDNEAEIVEPDIKKEIQDTQANLNLLTFDKTLKRRVRSARVPKPNNVKQQISRPLSAVLSRHKHVVFTDGLNDDDSRPGSASSFQLQRTEAWRSSASSGSGSAGFVDVAKDHGLPQYVGFVVTNTLPKASIKASAVKFSMGVRKPPPQRPTSPNQLSIVGEPANQSHSATNNSPSTPRQFQKTAEKKEAKDPTSKPPKPDMSKGTSRLASSWLADGRNVHQEKFDTRRLITSPRLPGYLEGTGLMPSKTAKPPTPIPVPSSDVAVHLLPSRPVKPFSRLPHTCYRRSLEAGHSVQSASLGGSLVWNRPRFSSLHDVKKLTGKPSTPHSAGRSHRRSRQ